jgi:hypothetical protein
VELDSFRPFLFFVVARVRIDPLHAWPDVRPRLESALLDAFGFPRRGFGQPVTAAEVLEVLHGIPAVEAVDLDQLYRTAPSEVLPETLFNVVLDARVARWDAAAGETLPAELLLIHPQGIQLSELPR